MQAVYWYRRFLQFQRKLYEIFLKQKVILAVLEGI